MKALLSTAYLPPVEYFLLIEKSDGCLVEHYEHYSKQSYRNRTCILTGNGKQALSIPVEQTHQKILTKDVRIDYTTRWQTNHWRALTAAYNSSPYFLYYQDFLQPFYEKKYTFLIDYNTELLHLLLKFLKVDRHIEPTTDYIAVPGDYYDAREIIHPKKCDRDDYPLKLTKPYRQVFEDRFGFTRNLSILDLLFNEGNDSPSFLNHCTLHLS